RGDGRDGPKPLRNRCDAHAWQGFLVDEPLGRDYPRKNGQKASVFTESPMSKPPDFHVLIPAAGAGLRVGGDLPKQYMKIHGKSVLRHTIERFLSLPGLKSLRVIIDPNRVTEYHEAVQGLDLPDP